jgi:hypothetical protein
LFAVGTVNSKGRASSNFRYKIMVDISEAFCPQAVMLLMLYSNVYFAKCRSVPINSLLFIAIFVKIYWPNGPPMSH